MGQAKPPPRGGALAFVDRRLQSPSVVYRSTRAAAGNVGCSFPCKGDVARNGRPDLSDLTQGRRFVGVRLGRGPIPTAVSRAHEANQIAAWRRRTVSDRRMDRPPSGLSMRCHWRPVRRRCSAAVLVLCPADAMKKASTNVEASREMPDKGKTRTPPSGGDDFEDVAGTGFARGKRARAHLDLRQRHAAPRSSATASRRRASSPPARRAARTPGRGRTS
jgi:hypothetical protein